MEYYKGRSNLAATIFVPVRCPNNCSFCTTNYMYDNLADTEECVTKIINLIRKCNKSDKIVEFVLTGGEPFSNLEITKRLIDEMEKPVYINTTLPDNKNIIKYINSEDKIKGISISRHIKYVYNNDCLEVLFWDDIKKSVRVNCIIDESLLRFIPDYIASFRDFKINFRADYRNVTLDNLKNQDGVFKYLAKHYVYKGVHTDNLVCYSTTFSNGAKDIYYYRGLEKSCLVFGDKCYVSDVIINPFGNIFKDWDMIPDKDFENWLFEGLK